MRLRQGVRRTLQSLRFRLVISYVAIFGVLLLGVGLVFRYDLSHTVDNLHRELIEEDWNAAASFLDISSGQATWTVDPRKTEHRFIVERLRRNLLISDADGKVLEVSNGYRVFGVESAETLAAMLRHSDVVWRTKTVPDSGTILFRQGPFKSGGQTYLLVIGRRLSNFSLLPATLTEDFLLALPALLAIAALIGWFFAGRALAPLNELAETAHRTSGSSLHLRIQGRGAADELDKLIEAFNTMMARLEANFDQVRRFSTDASHELRTPITVIRGQLEVALLTASNPTEFRDAICTALQDVDRLSNIVRALLMLSQAETGQLRLKAEPVNLAELVRELADQYTLIAEDAGVHLQYAAVPVSEVRGDKTQLERLVINLLSNAIKYNRVGGSVKLFLNDTSSHVELTVSDTGIGIPAGQQDHIFERFYRVRQDDTRNGLGLGLSFVAWIVKAHGGEIKVSSEEGKGTAFLVQLPKWTEPPPQLERAPLAEARQ